MCIRDSRHSAENELSRVRAIADDGADFVGVRAQAAHLGRREAHFQNAGVGRRDLATAGRSRKGQPGTSTTRNLKRDLANREIDGRAVRRVCVFQPEPPVGTVGGTRKANVGHRGLYNFMYQVPSREGWSSGIACPPPKLSLIHI